MSVLASLDRERFEMEVAGPTLRPEKDEGASFVAELAAQRVRFHPIEMRRAVSLRKDLGALAQLFGLIRRGRYDIVHGHSSKAGFLARVAGSLAGTPTVYTPHALYFLRHPSGRERTLYLGLERFARPFTTRFVAVSESEKDVALREKLAPAERIVVIPNGIEPAAFVRPAHARAHVRAELGIPLDAAVIGTAARLTAQKDPECLVHAIREVISRTRRAVYFVWAGDGELDGHVERIVHELGLHQWCRLLGFRRDVRSVMCAFDVFALTSRYEGLPYAVLEAMALGLPVVATNVVGTRDLVADGVNGFLVPPGDAVAAADSLLRLIDNPSLGVEFGQRARTLVEERFTLAAMIERLASLYAELAGRDSESSSATRRAHRQTALI
jgi:glycosyltransferase involved in cell wall biosynthesis